MTSIRAIAILIGDLTCGYSSAGTAAADALIRAGHIGALDADATAGDAARLLTALMATDNTVNMAYAVERFSALPLRVCGVQVGDGVPAFEEAENVAIEPGCGPVFNRISQSFVGALAYLMELASRGPRLHTLVSVRRTLGSPLAKLHVLSEEPAGVLCRRDLWYMAAGPSDEGAHMLVAAELAPAMVDKIAAAVATGSPYTRFIDRFIKETDHAGTS